MSYKVDIVYKNVKNLKISLSKDGLITVVSPKGITKKKF